MENLSENIIHPEISLDGFLRFISSSKEFEYKFISFNDLTKHDKCIILRHDVDFGLIDYAYDMAKIEQSHAIVGTYFLMLRNPLYNLFAKKNYAMVREIIDMGHHIGLHFDPSFYPLEGSVDKLYSFIREEIRVLSRLFDKNIYYFSIHKPLASMIRNNIISVNEFESVYNKEYFRDIKYMSDSCGRWRGPSIIEIVKSKRHDKIQLLVHPALWMETRGNRLKDRIRAIVDKKCSHMEIELRDTVNDANRKIYLV